MQKWEYLTFYGSLSEVRLNELGEEGWELIAIIVSNENADARNFYFKRPKL